jgi:hypothetical protein
VSADPERSALDAQVLDWMCEPLPIRPPADEARFDALALSLFAHQFARCAPYRRFCERRGITPGRASSWRQIPPVPTGAFKEVPLVSFPAERIVHTFRTSGTTGERRGELHLDTLEIYEASLLPTFFAYVLPDVPTAAAAASAPTRLVLRVLSPPPEEAPDSSLSHMFGAVLRARADARDGFDVRAGELVRGALVERLSAAAEAGEPVALCGTAFAFVHLLDHLAEAGLRIALPAASRAMETGGFKGRGREITRHALHQRIHHQLSIPPDRIVNQYGMTELGSQFYDSVLRLPGEPRRKLGPPWARVRIVDPATGDECAPGDLGVIVVCDLANTGSVIAVETADLGRLAGDGFEVIGRAPGAEARGCSIAADVMLGEGPAG